MSETKLTGRVVIVTGGGQGLGEAICRTLAMSGAVVAVCDINAAQAKTVEEEIVAAGGKAKAFALDVTDDVLVKLCVQRVEEELERVDVLVNNAGTDITKGIHELSVEEWDRVLNVNLRGPFLMTRAVFPLFVGQGYGHIVNITSTAAKRTWTEASAYHASKWGLLGFSHAIHAEARRDNIKVTAVVAGGMRTPFIMDRFPDTDPEVLQDPQSVAETVQYVLLTPSDSVIPEVMVVPMRETSWP